MQTSLFDDSTLKQQSPIQEVKVTEEKIAQPLVQILEEVTPKDVNQKSSSESNIKNFKQSLDDLFPEQQYDEKNIKKAKDILGNVGDELKDIQLRSAVAEIQYLAETWLDNFEQSIFNGSTLMELLHEKGGQV